jgi:D-arabinose 1-dehydrogenase-like Zn-dependent alcohol dehydrogenase
VVAVWGADKYRRAQGIREVNVRLVGTEENQFVEPASIRERIQALVAASPAYSPKRVHRILAASRYLRDPQLTVDASYRLLVLASIRKPIARVVGLGGLGHMGVKFAAAFGAEVVLFTTSESKVADGKRLGADEVIISKNADAMAKHAGSFDMILDTVSADHDLNALLGLIKLDGSLVMVGAPGNPQPVSIFSLFMPRKHLSGSLIGGIAETQEMLDFCGQHNIVCDIEKIRIQQINEAYERMLKSDVKYRFVIDMASIKN